MPHEVWNLGPQSASARLQLRRFIGGMEPAQDVFIGRSRARKKMMVILNAWVEPVEVTFRDASDQNGWKISLALGKDPLNDALLLPVALQQADHITGGAANPAGVPLERLFEARGFMGAIKAIAIDFQEIGTITADVDVHMDWTVAETDWFTWFVSWNELEAAPDGSLIDGERSYV